MLARQREPEGAELVKKSPMMEMAIDQYRGMKEGVQGDGSKAEWGDDSPLKDVGRAYTIEHELP